LLVRLRDPGDAEAWRQFVRLYAPLVYRFARGKGLQDADAADVTQDVLRGVGGRIGTLDYRAESGTFRGWLFTMARRRLIDFWKSKRHRERGSGDSAVALLLSEQAAPDEEERWNQDFRRRLFHWAAEQVRPRFQEATWQAFWQTAVAGRSGREVAAELGLSVAAVYLAKGRVMARLKEQIQALSDDPF
jgi:RNA polymerase sigma-70 factor (ECF subfamily)